jgi:hypothetical protein
MKMGWPPWGRVAWKALRGVPWEGTPGKKIPGIPEGGRVFPSQDAVSRWGTAGTPGRDGTPRVAAEPMKAGHEGPCFGIFPERSTRHLTFFARRGAGAVEQGCLLSSCPGETRGRGFKSLPLRHSGRRGRAMAGPSPLPCHSFRCRSIHAVATGGWTHLLPHRPGG